MLKTHTTQLTPYLSLDKKNNIKKRFFAILLIIAVVLVATSLFATAKDCNCDAVEGVHKEGDAYPCTEGWNALNKAAYNWKNFLNNAFNLAQFDGLFEADFSSGLFGIVWNGAETIYNVIIPIGYLLVILYLVLDIIEHTTRDNLNTEFMIKITIKLFIGIFFITNGLELLKGAANFSNGLIDLLNNPSGNGGDAISEATYNQIKDMKWYNCIGIIIDSIIPYLLSFLSLVVIWFMLYSRYIEIGIRAIFAPIGMANIFEGGMNSSGMKYFKKYLAALLQGAIMCGVLIVGNFVSLAISSTSFVASAAINIGPQIILQLCICGMIIKSKSFANDLMGVS